MHGKTASSFSPVDSFPTFPRDVRRYPMQTKEWSTDLVNELVANAVPLVMESLLSGLHRLDLKSPLGSITLRYYDTCAPIIYFLVDIHTVQDLSAKIAEGKTKDIWLGYGSIDFTVGDPEENELSSVLARGYTLMCLDEEELAKYGFTEEDCFVSRRIAVEVCRQLSDEGLPFTLKVGDNFFAHAQNSTEGIQIYTDILGSIPPYKLQDLRNTEIWFDRVEKEDYRRG